MLPPGLTFFNTQVQLIKVLYGIQRHEGTWCAIESRDDTRCGPTHRLTFATDGLTGPLQHLVHMHRKLVALVCTQMTGGAEHIYSKLLAQFANQSIRMTLAKLNLATWELPSSA